MSINVQKNAFAEKMHLHVKVYKRCALKVIYASLTRI